MTTRAYNQLYLEDAMQIESGNPRLKAIRKRQHITQRELSVLSGVTLRMIHGYEQGDQDIRKAEAQTVLALSRVLGCTPEVLCEG